jgi:thioesterase domain-containing protein
MNPEEIEIFFKNNIPMANCMGISVLSCDENSLVSAAPLEYNKNDKGTGFAGSIFSLSALSGWGFLRSIILRENINCDIMLHVSEIVYQKPVLDDIIAEAKIENPGELKFFFDDLRLKGKSRIEVTVSIISANDLKAVFKGSYVAVLK